MILIRSIISLTISNQSESVGLGETKEQEMGFEPTTARLEI